MLEELVEAFAVGLGVLLAIGAGTGVAGWFTVRKVRSSRIIERARDRSMLAARAYSPDPLTREPARLIGNLARSSRATHLALSEAKDQGRPVGDLPRAAAEIDQENYEKWFVPAGRLISNMVLREDYPAFLTLSAYDLMEGSK